MATKRTMSEDQHQKKVINWTVLHAGICPQLLKLFHIPNGGKRNKIEAAKFKAMGVKAGVADLCLPVARRGFHSLYIELKAEDGKPSKKQTEWGESVRAEGNAWIVCHGWRECVNVIIKYMGMDASLLKEEP